jgi:NAD+ synthase (glutamine-hydrolysing)
VRKNKFDHVVIGISGGIDSALTATIAADALGPESVTGVSMPSVFTSTISKTDAEKLAENLGIELLTVPIQDVLESYKTALKGVFKGMPQDVTEENLQARIRGNYLMALSNKFRWLVLTTGNKSEMATGYATLYGDMAGGFAVLKDVPKTLVYELADYRNKLGEVIPRSIIERAPSAELKPDQLDADTLPPYDILDPILHLYIEQDASPTEIIEKGYAEEVVRRVVAMVDSNEYKRRQSPPGVKITPKAFGKDRRLPITNAFRE